MITFMRAGHLDLLDPPVTVQSICATSYDNEELTEFKRLLTAIILSIIQNDLTTKELLAESVKDSRLDIDID